MSTNIVNFYQLSAADLDVGGGCGGLFVKIDGLSHLHFNSAAEFVTWCDRLFELAHAVPEIAAAWSTYPVQP